VESLGNKLKTARETKGYTFDYVSRETNISTRYLQALEEEDFAVFPGEPYLLGFLRNYGGYLELNVDELLSLYRSLKIQEQPIPVEQLLKDPFPWGKLIAIALVVIVVLGLAGGGYLIFSRMPQAGTNETAAVRPASEYSLNTDSLERRFYRGDTILVPLDGNTYKLELTSLGDTVTITTPSGPVRLDLGQEVTIDLNNSGAAALRITAADFVKNDPAPGALLRFELQSIAFQNTGNVDAAGISPEAINTITPNLQTASAIFTSPSAYPFTLQSTFQGYCLFRWEILAERDRQGRNEQYFQRSDELNIQAQNGIRIGVSNAQAAKLQVIGGGRTVPLDLGGAGEVVVADLRWVRDEDSRYRLVLVRLE
jgi:cytoskeletal protein RodZ